MADHTHSNTHPKKIKKATYCIIKCRPLVLANPRQHHSNQLATHAIQSEINKHRSPLARSRLAKSVDEFVNYIRPSTFQGLFDRFERLGISAIRGQGVKEERKSSVSVLLRAMF